MFKEYGFIWKCRFFWYQGFWPEERHIRMLKYIENFGKK